MVLLMKDLSRDQDLHLMLIELASRNDLNGVIVATDLRANLDLWRSAQLVRPAKPVFEKLENPLSGTSPPVSLVNRVDLTCLRDLPQNFVNLDTLFILADGNGGSPRSSSLTLAPIRTGVVHCRRST